jgi:ribosomal protein L7/L12
VERQRGRIAKYYADHAIYVCIKNEGDKKMGTIKEVLMRRDGMTAEEANDLIEDARNDLHERLAEGEMPEDICQEWFGLEPDYITELM